MSIVKNYYLIDVDLISLTLCLDKIEQHYSVPLYLDLFFDLLCYKYMPSNDTWQRLGLATVGTLDRFLIGSHGPNTCKSSRSLYKSVGGESCQSVGMVLRELAQKPNQNLRIRLALSTSRHI